MAKVVKRKVRSEPEQPPPPAVDSDADPSQDESGSDGVAGEEYSEGEYEEDNGLALSSDEEPGGSSDGEGDSPSEDFNEDGISEGEADDEDESDPDFQELKEALADYHKALEEEEGSAKSKGKKGRQPKESEVLRESGGASTTGRGEERSTRNGQGLKKGQGKVGNGRMLQEDGAIDADSRKQRSLEKVGAPKGEEPTADGLQDEAAEEPAGNADAGQAVSLGDGVGAEQDGDAEHDGDSEDDWRPRVEESDSSEDERPDRNTIGDVPLEWYKDEEHIGYDREGKKLIKKERKDKLDSFLAQADNPKEWRTIYDEYNDEDIVLTREEIEMIKRVREGRTPHAEVNPYEPYLDWFDYEGGPLNSGPEPKRRFIPSKWEAKKVVKLVRAMRKGWIKLEKAPEKPKVYLLWGDDHRTAEKTANGLTYIPPPKPNLPGHEESYNPPLEYLPTQEELNAYQLMYEEDRPKFIPKKFDSLREVPSYAEFIKERFERCLDLYLCPRTRKKRINIDPESLVPKLPKPKDLQPFPTTLALEFIGHQGPVRTLSTDPTGQWLASGSHDGTVRVWEIATGRCRRVYNLGGPIRHVAWNPLPERQILGAAVGRRVVLLSTAPVSAGPNALLVPAPPAKSDGTTPLATWGAATDGGMELAHKHEVQHIAWHHRGDYFATVAPEGGTVSVLVHQLSKQATQNPFKKNHGRVQRVLFHPSRPFFFVATQTHVRCYNLAKQQLAKKLTAGVNSISSMAIHPGGDNLIVGGHDRKLVWFDMDLSTKPYRTLRYHESAVEGVAFHPSYPLFASASDDGTAQVFHGMVYADLLQNPLLVPLKILRGHTVVESEGVLDCVFHPSQPWLFTAGADKTIKLFCN